MRTIKVKDKQCLLDIAMEHCGDVSAVYDIANLNGLSITDDLTTGQMLFVPDVIVVEIVEMFKPSWLTPASAEPLNSELVDEGLGFWILEEDFVIGG